VLGNDNPVAMKKVCDFGTWKRHDLHHFVTFRKSYGGQILE